MAGSVDGSVSEGERPPWVGRDDLGCQV